MSDMENIDVMISLHVGSMKSSALALKETLEAKGLSVWICVELAGGDSYRTEIVKAVKKCKVFLPLLNNAWALSGECEDEYSLAKRLNLTSHESKRTTRSERRLPIMMPIAFSDLEWSAHPHVELLAASTNFIVHQGSTLNEGPIDTTFNQLFSSLQGCGFSIAGLPQHPKPRAADKGAGATGAAAAPKQTIKSQIVEMHGMLQSITSTMQALALSPLDEKMNSMMSTPANNDVSGKEATLGKEYQGTVAADNSIQGVGFEFCDSVLLKLDYDPASGRCSGTITIDSIMKSIEGYDSVDDVPEDHFLYEWVNTADHEVHTFEGSFSTRNKMMSIADVETTGDASNMHKYYLTLHEDRLIGVQQALQMRHDLEDSSATESLNLMRVR